MKKSFMQKFLQTMLLVALICVPWVTWSQEYSFTCDFENDADTAAWDFANGATTNNWYIGSVVNNGGSRSLYISQNGTAHTYLGNLSSVYAYQTLTLEAGSYEYSYDWMCDGESTFDYIRVALAPGSTNFVAGSTMGIDARSIPAGWISMDGGTKLNKSEVWTTQTGIISVPETGDYKLVFFWHNDGSGQNQPPAAIDNIEIIMPNCPAPMGLTVNDIKSDSATVSWSNVGASYEWEVECVASGVEPGMGLGTVYTVSDTFCVLENLNAMTDYEVYVRGNCGSEYSSYVSAEFTTACGPIELPYLESFETAPHYGFPECWSDLAGSSSVYSNGSSNPVTRYGNNYLAMYENARIATPYINAPLNTLAVDISLRMYDYEAGDLEVGVVTDLSMLDQVTLIDTLVLPDGLMHDFELELSSLDISEGGYLVFRQINTFSDYSPLYLDNIFIRAISDCQRPQSMVATNITHNSAILRWDAIEGSSGYDVVYGTSNNLESTDNIMMTYIGDDTIALTDLEPETTYNMWVRNICGNEYSEWRSGGSFTTQIACAKVLDFEVASVSSTGIALTWRYDTHVGIAATQAEVSWKASDTNVYSSALTNNNYFIIQGLTAGTSYDVRVRTICNTDTAQYASTTISTELNGVTVGHGTNGLTDVPSRSNYKYGYSQIYYPANDLTQVNTITGIAFDVNGYENVTRKWDVYMGHTDRTTITTNSYVPIDSLTLVASNVNFPLTKGWHSIPFATPFIHHIDSNLVIVVDDNTGSYSSMVKYAAHPGVSLSVRSDNTNYDPHNLTASLSNNNYVPNIVFLCPETGNDCQSSLLVAGNFTATSADLAWNQGLIGNTWQVEYKLASETEWTVFAYTVSDTTITIPNLQSGASYDFRIGTNCSDGLYYSNVVSGFTACAAISAPFSEDFSSNEENPCWIYGHKHSDTDLPHVTSSTLSMCYVAGGYVILPQFLDEISSLHTMFSVKSVNENAEVVVAVGNDPDNILSFVDIDTFAVTTSNEFQPQECSFANYQGDGHYIAFYTLGNSIYLDDILVEALPTCGYPSNIVVEDVLSESATLSWEGNVGTTTGWLIAYKTDNAQRYDTVLVTPEQTSVTLTDLLSNSNYEVLVSNLCGVDTVEALSAVTFTTECAELMLPYTENFETVALYAYPNCWHTTGFHSYSSGYDDRIAPEINAGNSEHGKVLKFGDNCNMITPRIPAEANTIKVMFDAMSDDTEYAGKLAVGFTTSASDISNAIYVDTIVFTNLHWNHYDISFTSLETTEEGYVVFRNIDNTYEWGTFFEEYYDGYIDNVTIMIDNGCPVVSDIAVSNITADGAEISFTDASASGNYSIGYSTINNGNNIPNIVDCNATTYTLTGLEQGTTYYTWVRNNCAQGSSLWAEGPVFVTNCEAWSTLPYEEDFDNYTTDVSTSITNPITYPNHAMPNCWSFLNMSQTGGGYPRSFMCNSATLHYADSAACLMMISSKTTPFYAILPQFSDHVSQLQISFTYRNESISISNGTLALGVMTDVADASSFTLIQEYPQSNVVTSVTHSFAGDNLSTDENYFIALRYTGGDKNNYFLGLDNVVVDFAPDCAIPEMVTITDLNANDISLTWSGNASSYNVQYRETNATEWTDALAVTTTATTIANLNSQTEYQVRVQSNCGTSVSDWSNIITFTTACGVVNIPYTENFDSYASDIASGSSAPMAYPNHTMPTCWTFPVLETNSPKIFLSDNSSYAVTGNCLFFSSSSTRYAYAVLPVMNASLDALQISFTYRNEGTTSNNAKLSLGVMTNPNDPTTFVLLDTYPANNVKTSIEHDFSLDTEIQQGTSYYIAFRYGDGSTNYYLGLDDVTVNYRATCPRPNTPTLIRTTDAVAEISLDGNSSSYEVAYKLSSTENWTSLPLTSSNLVTLTGLNGTSEYNVRVRAICGAGDTSYWSYPLTFTTDCAPMQLPFFEDFTGVYDIDDLDYWHTYIGLLSEIQNNTASFTPGEWYTWSFSESYPLGNYGRNVSIDIYGANTKGWLVSPNINLSTNAALEFDLGRREYNNTMDADDRFIVLISTDNGATWLNIRTWLGNDFDQIPLYTTDSSLHEVIDLGNFVGNNVRIAFYGESTIEGSDHYIHLDNVSVHATQTPTPTCDAPTALAVTNITESGAKLTWNGEASAYDVEYRVQNTEAWNTDQSVTTSFTLTGLQHSTTYDWRVRANCGDTQSDWVTNTFTTLTPQPTCDVPTALNANVTETSVTIDWTAAEGQSSWEINITAEDIEDINQIVSAHPITINNLAPETYTVKVRALCAEDVYSNWSETIEFTIEEVEEPDCDPVTNVVALDITETTARITWTPAEGQSAWEIVYGESGFDHTTAQVMAVNVAAYEITNLTANTNYDVYVRAVCGEDLYSEWSEKTTFQTLQADEPESIDGITGDYQFAIYPNPTHEATTISLTGVEGKVTISVIDINGRPITTETLDCNSDCEKRMDVSGLSQGTYFVHVLGANINSVRKLIVR